MDYAASDNLVAYTAAGDMKLDLREQHTGTFHFPSCHSHGLTVAFDRNIVKESLPCEVRDFPATPEKIVERWQLGSTPRVVRGAERMEHIFGEMYRVPEKIRIPYFKVKILELLLCLDAMTIPQEESERPYFYKTQVEKVEAIKRFLTEHVAENFTQEELLLHRVRHERKGHVRLRDRNALRQRKGDGSRPVPRRRMGGSEQERAHRH